MDIRTCDWRLVTFAHHTTKYAATSNRYPSKIFALESSRLATRRSRRPAWAGIIPSRICSSSEESRSTRCNQRHIHVLCLIVALDRPFRGDLGVSQWIGRVMAGVLGATGGNSYPEGYGIRPVSAAPICWSHPDSVTLIRTRSDDFSFLAGRDAILTLSLLGPLMVRGAVFPFF